MFYIYMYIYKEKRLYVLQHQYLLPYWKKNPNKKRVFRLFPLSLGSPPFLRLLAEFLHSEELCLERRI